jgi:GDP-4-dehydro-6-deoxy-D-mannose reductase
VTPPVSTADLAGARVLVTGASGFVGGHLRRVLADRGAAVFGLGTEPSPPSADFAGWARADLTDSSSTMAALRSFRPDAVVHLAGQASAGLSFEAPELTFRVNVVGTWNVLQAVADSAGSARVLIVGSGEAYGPQPAGSRVSEDAPFRPVSPYAFSKAAADAVAHQFGVARGIFVVRTRSFSHAGPGQTTRFALPSFAMQIAAIERSGKPGVLRVGNLAVVRDILDVRDVAACYARLLEVGRSGEAYNVSSGSGIALHQVVESLAAMARVPIRVEVDADRFRPADVPYLVGDARKVGSETGWTALRSLEETLSDLLESARADGREV